MFRPLVLAFVLFGVASATNSHHHHHRNDVKKTGNKRTPWGQQSNKHPIAPTRTHKELPSKSAFLKKELQFVVRKSALFSSVPFRRDPGLLTAAALRAIELLCSQPGRLGAYAQILTKPLVLATTWPGMLWTLSFLVFRNNHKTPKEWKRMNKWFWWTLLYYYIILPMLIEWCCEVAGLSLPSNITELWKTGIEGALGMSLIIKLLHPPGTGGKPKTSTKLSNKWITERLN